MINITDAKQVNNNIKVPYTGTYTWHRYSVTTIVILNIPVIMFSWQQINHLKRLFDLINNSLNAFILKKNVSNFANFFTHPANIIVNYF
jgi:uncharacterized membrane-anchored protein YitT (DUF2179 family)